MILKPTSLKAANEYITTHHRHHGKVQGHKFSISLLDDDGETIGIVVIGRPVARMLDDGFTAEVTRLCTTGTPNACSALYSAAWRACRAMGYRKLITYILESEAGTSLKATGWVNEGAAGGGTWNRPNIGRDREDKAPITGKQRWSVSY